MVRVNLFVLCIALVVLIAAGPEIEHLLTKDRFGQHLLVAALLIGQLMFSSIESALWSAYNAAGDAVLLNRASMISSLIAVPIVMAAGALTGAIGVAAVAGFRVVILASMLLKVEGGEPARCLLTCPVGMRSFAVALLSLGVTFWAVLVFQTTRGSGFSSLWLALIVFGSSAGLLRFAKLSEISTVARLVNAVR
jgi:O-antigen/teichoic acid export membrane protein